MYLIKAISTKNGGLLPEMKLVHRDGKVFTQTFHVKVGDAVKYRREGVDRKWRSGIVRKIDKDTVHVLAKRSNDSFKQQVHKVTAENVLSMEAYRNQSVKPADPRYTSEGDRTQSRHNLTAAEYRKRQKIVEDRLGFKEDRILEHASFRGPCIKTVSELARQNGISTAMQGKLTAGFWNQAVDLEYREMLMNYAVGAFKCWRRELAKPLNDQVKRNLEEFKAVLDDKRKSSYVHVLMGKEGKAAAIRHLQERRKMRDVIHEMDIGTMVEDPNARRLLERHSSQPMQLKHVLSANGESLHDDMVKILSTMEPSESEAVRIKFGFHPYKPVTNEEGGERVMSNDRVAARLNELGYRDDKNMWTRNTVGNMLTGAFEKILRWPMMEALRFHRDDLLGRNIWKSRPDSFMGGKAEENVRCADLDRLLAELDEFVAGKRV